MPLKTLISEYFAHIAHPVSVDSHVTWLISCDTSWRSGGS